MTTLVAGIGNIFNADDGFGVEVANQLTARAWPDDVRVEDYGIRGLHLAMELLEGYDLLVLIDAIDGDDPPGTLSLLQITLDRDAPPLDAHSMDPQAVLATMAGMGGEIGRVLVVGCCPASLEEAIGLSPPVAAAVPAAMAMVEEVIEQRNVPCLVP